MQSWGQLDLLCIGWCLDWNINAEQRYINNLKNSMLQGIHLEFGTMVQQRFTRNKIQLWLRRDLWIFWDTWNTASSVLNTGTAFFFKAQLQVKLTFRKYSRERKVKPHLCCVPHMFSASLLLYHLISLRGTSREVCHEIFKVSVLLSCCQSFCKTCVQRWWTEEQIHERLVCKSNLVM